MKRLMRALLVLPILLVLFGCTGSNYKKAVSLFEAGNYEEARELFEKLGDYEDSGEYITKIEILMNPVSAIEEAIRNDFDKDKSFWKTYNEYLNLAKSLGFATSGGTLVFETKYDEQSKEFASLVDIPVMKGSTVYHHYYYGITGHMDFTNVVIDKIDSIELNEKRAASFWAQNWKH